MPHFTGDQAGVSPYQAASPARIRHFSWAILKGCREAGIHTAIETCGYVNERLFSRLLEEVDLVLFDLKLMDPDKHYAATGRRNDRILSNARFLAGSGKAVRFRMPLIPGINDGADNLKQLADFLTFDRPTFN